MNTLLLDINTPDVATYNEYYSFGLKHKGYNNNITSTNPALKYKFGGKEYNDELGLDWYDVSARNYDPALGRWMNIDPLAEKMRRHSPYNFGFDNPVYFQDYDGMMPSGPIDELKKKVAKTEGKVIDAIETLGNELVSLGESFVNLFSQKSATNYTTKEGDGKSPSKIATVKKENMDTMREADKLVAVLKAGGSTGKGSKVSTKSSANPNTVINKFKKGKGDGKATGEYATLNATNFAAENLSTNSSTMNAENTAGESGTVTVNISDYRKNPAMGSNRVTVSEINPRDTIVKTSDTAKVNLIQKKKEINTLNN